MLVFPSINFTNTKLNNSFLDVPRQLAGRAFRYKLFIGE